MGRRRTVVLGAAVGSAATLIFMASFAWACTNFLRIDAISTPAEAPLATSTVHGEGAPTGATVELRWNAVKGPVLAKTTANGDGTFSASISAPDVAPGIYILVAKVGDHVGRAAIEVRAGAGMTASPGVYATTNEGQSGGGLGAHGIELAIFAGGLMLLAAGTVVAMARRRQLAPATASASVDGFQELVELGRR